MATESDLRALLRDPDPEGRPAIDLDAVITRARRRRRPKVLAAQALGSVAVVGAVFTGVVATLPREETTMMVADEAAGGSYESAPAPADADLRWAMDACGEPPIDGASPTWALETVLGGDVDGLTATLTLRNEGDAAATGATTPWALTLVRDGVVVGRASFPDAATTPYDLAAGDAVETTLGAVVESCDPATPLEPGAYDVRGVVEVLDQAADGRNEVVYGELVPVELR